MQDAATALAERIEPLAAEMWPARETVAIGGWLARLTDGYSHRANSVLPLAFGGDRLDVAIDAAERVYGARGLQTMFHISPAAQPPALEPALIARGYELMSATHVCTAHTHDIEATLGLAGDTIRCGSDDARFQALVVAGSRSLDDGRERLAVLQRLTQPHVRILALEKGDVVACGFGIRLGDWVAVGLMRSAEGHRRRGHAGRVLAAIAAWAAAENVQNVFLQVEDNNAPARALYAKAGFAPVYPYRCYRKT